MSMEMKRRGRMMKLMLSMIIHAREVGPWRSTGTARSNTPILPLWEQSIATPRGS